uniref:RNA-directed DNA polymerase n=1 Tax=Lactobacillus sp. ESL0225 TaxID=2069351 RepID=UPI000EFABC29|nr:RNA-directed DNA polymerase [Lactobacillus sp. ESL0225]RMC48167.1 RNA-directed DNA polymerase [Lactobacillus sp. ESL0225]
MEKKRQSVLDMNCDEARKFFMKEESYCSLQLPEYFSFKQVLAQAEKKLRQKKPVSYDANKISDVQTNKNSEENSQEINHTIIINKDGKYDWRPIKIVHPIAYVDLVNIITTKSHWNQILRRFDYFRKDKAIRCISLPRQALGIHNNNTKENILNWWEEFEQYSIEVALKYSYCVQTDITNCYGSIYTHTIAWALEGKDKAKDNHSNKLLGNIIDTKIRNMQNRQTNGIPQGGALFDFIAEIVLGYSDQVLSTKINSNSITKGKKYQVIRYKDDYRIFANSKEVADVITKMLADTLLDLNMHLNLRKTKSGDDLIGMAIKPDKLYWNHRNINIFSIDKSANEKNKQKYSINYHMNLQKHLLEIYILSKKFPNSGSIKKAFSEYLDRIDSLDVLPSDYKQLISIIANIIIVNPNAIPQGVAIISHIFALMKKSDSNDVPENFRNFIDEILTKLHTIPNTDYLEVWLQRISVAVDKEYTKYNSPLCQKVRDNKNVIWDSTWLKEDFIEDSVIDVEKLDKIQLSIPKDNVNPFSVSY